MQLLRENLYGTTIGSPSPIKVSAWWTASPCTKRGIMVQTLLPSWIKKAGWGKVSGYIGLLPGQTSWPGGKCNVLAAAGIAGAAQGSVTTGSSLWNGVLEEWDPLSSCCRSTRGLALPLLCTLYCYFCSSTQAPVKEVIWLIRPCGNGWTGF